MPSIALIVAVWAHDRVLPQSATRRRPGLHGRYGPCFRAPPELLPLVLHRGRIFRVDKAQEPRSISGDVMGSQPRDSARRTGSRSRSRVPGPSVPGRRCRWRDRPGGGSDRARRRAPAEAEPPCETRQEARRDENQAREQRERSEERDPGEHRRRFQVRHDRQNRNESTRRRDRRGLTAPHEQTKW